MQKQRAVSIAVLLLLIVTLFTLFACCCPGSRPRTAPQGAQPAAVSPIGQAELPVPLEATPAKETDVEMRNVMLHTDATIVLHVRELRGQMFDKEAGKPLNFDNRQSFVVKISSANIGVDSTTLTDLMNRYVFNYAGSPISDLMVRFENGHVTLEATVHKIVALPVRIIADASVTPDGWIRLHPTKIEICNVNGAALMRAFGLSLEKVMTKLPAGVRAEGNDMLIEPLRILPPPAIQGKLASVAIEGNELAQTFDDGRNLAPLQPPLDAKNYMYYRNGTLRIGKLFMVSADMQVIDTDQSDPFDFYLDQYNAQLVSGYDRNRLDYGLTVYMRDHEDVGRPPRPGERLAP